MGMLKKLCVTSMLGVMLAVPTYATVVTGSQSDANLDLKYPLVSSVMFSLIVEGIVVFLASILTLSSLLNKLFINSIK